MCKHPEILNCFNCEEIDICKEPAKAAWDMEKPIATESATLCKCGECNQTERCQRFGEGCLCNSCDGEPKGDLFNCYLQGERGKNADHR